MVRATAAVLVLAWPSVEVAKAGPRDFFSVLLGGSSDPKLASSQSSSSQASSQAVPDASGDFFSDLFGLTQPKRVIISRSSDSFCVRTCDGRYFPVVARNGQSAADACHNFCPAAETKIFRGPSIDNASNEQGKLYSAIPNAFRYRNELVDNCTCGGAGTGGLATIKIEDDPTLRRGDIVASADGLMVVGDRGRNNELKLSPAPGSVSAQYKRKPAKASR
ncbi:MAG: DUF2865 domain-containing protein [Bradyrhizobiaceae bacterium]|nr:MAG: DUF2865 domain-containing protein [Bradyrhizobiaceae bacterium]